MRSSLYRVSLLFLSGSLSLSAADKAPALQRTDAGVPVGPQSLAGRAKTMRVNRAVFSDFNPPQVLSDPEPTPAPTRPQVPSPESAASGSSGTPLPQPRRINPLGELFEAQKAAAVTGSCPKASADQKQAANDRLEKASQNYERFKAQVQQRQKP
jgi:hypothetical protein